MKSTELRIGNLAYVNGVLRKITSVDILNLDGFSDQRLIIEPIELSEEWLVKFGFKNTHDSSYDSTKMIPYSWIECSEDKILLDSADGKNLELNHVHQIQNLYFALTGEELTINK